MRVGVGELPVAVDLGDLVLLHQEVHAGDAALGDLAAAVEGDAVVEGRLAADAERLGFLGEDVGEFGVAQQRLRRDAADVEADPAPVLGFDDGGVQPELGGANGRDVSAGTGSENDDVIVSHVVNPSSRCGRRDPFEVVGTVQQAAAAAEANGADISAMRQRRDQRPVLHHRQQQAADRAGHDR